MARLATYATVITESSYDTPLHHYHFVVFPGLSAYRQRSDQINPKYLAQ